MREALELAFMDKEKFISKVQHRLPTTAKAAYFIALVGVAFIIAGCTPTIESSYVQEEASPTATFTATQTQTQTVTPTKTEMPTPTPISIELDVFESEVKEGNLLWTLIEIQKIVNNYDSSLNVSFQEYISREIESDMNENLSNILHEISTLENFNILTLTEILQKGLFDSNIPDLSPWPNSMYDVLPEPYIVILSDPERYPLVEDQAAGYPLIPEREVYVINGDLYTKFHLVMKGSLIINTDTFSKDRSTELEVYLIASVKEEDGKKYVLTVSINSEGEIILDEVEQSETREIFGSGRWVSWARLTGFNAR